MIDDEMVTEDEEEAPRLKGKVNSQTHKVPCRYGAVLFA